MTAPDNQPLTDPPLGLAIYVLKGRARELRAPMDAMAAGGEPYTMERMCLDVAVLAELLAVALEHIERLEAGAP